MRPKNSDNRRRNRKNQSPIRTRPVTSIESDQTRSSGFSPSAASPSLVDNELITDELSLFQSLQISPESSGPNPRSFPYAVKQQCWEKAEKIKGRDPERWRKDALGNTVFKKLGGKSTLENCQVLQATVNRSKGNRTEITKSELIQRSSYCRVSGRDMDLIELTAYGNVRRGQDTGGCNIQ